MDQFDAIIIGGGPGGVKTAKVLAKSGKKVALIADDLGGECLNYGCIPTNTYLWTAELFEKN
jgi:dihydrolipoamide dehydrogenase